MESTREQQQKKIKEYPPTSLKPNHVCRIFRGKEKDVFGMFEMQLKSKEQKAKSAVLAEFHNTRTHTQLHTQCG